MAKATKERAIRFKPWEILAILNGSMTQFRRVIDPQPTVGRGRWKWQPTKNQYPSCEWTYLSPVKISCHECSIWTRHCPFGKPGNRLWVQEKWAPFDTNVEDSVSVLYAASFREDLPIRAAHQEGAVHRFDAEGLLASQFYEAIKRFEVLGQRWFSATQMPRCLSRLTLEVEDVRVERMNSISKRDSRKCGYRKLPERTAYDQWVWVIDFKRVEA